MTMQSQVKEPVIWRWLVELSQVRQLVEEAFTEQAVQEKWHWDRTWVSSTTNSKRGGRIVIIIIIYQ